WYQGTSSLLPKLSVGNQEYSTTGAVSPGSTVTIEVQHLDPNKYVDLLGTLYNHKDTYTRKAGQIVVVSLDANQYSSSRIAQIQAGVNTALTTVGSGFASAMDKDDIDDV